MDADECFMSSVMWLRDPLICSREYRGALGEGGEREFVGKVMCSDCEHLNSIPLLVGV